MIDILPDGVGGRVLRLLVRLAVTFGLSRHLVAVTPRRGRFEGNRLTRDRRRFSRTLSLVEHDPRLAIVGLTYGWLAAAYASIAALGSEPADPGMPVLILQAGAGPDRLQPGAALALPTPAQWRTAGACRRAATKSCPRSMRSGPQPGLRLTVSSPRAAKARRISLKPSGASNTIIPMRHR